MPAASPLILAISSTDSPMVLWIIVGFLVALGPAINSWIRVFAFFKGERLDPSIYVTKAELAAHKAERDAQINLVFKGFRDELRGLRRLVELLDNHLRQELPGLHRSLGRAEGQLQSMGEDDDEGHDHRPR